MVYASNANLQARCDGIDERTLRRRLAKLCDLGLITRHQSPNRKRYVVRNEMNEPVLTYGFDLQPIRNGLSQLEALAAQQKANQTRLGVLRAILRDRLYHFTLINSRSTNNDADAASYQRLLRRKATIQDLSTAIQTLEAALESEQQTIENKQTTPKMSDSVSHFDRHIQSSKEDYYEKKAQPNQPTNKRPTQLNSDVSLEECIVASSAAMEFSAEKPQSWREVEDLALLLGPAIGLSHSLIKSSQSSLGDRGACLAILGLIQAMPRIQHPKNYLQSLLNKALQSTINIPKMFRSLTRTLQFPAGNQLAG